VQAAVADATVGAGGDEADHFVAVVVAADADDEVDLAVEVGLQGGDDRGADAVGDRGDAQRHGGPLASQGAQRIGQHVGVGA
jgi:hypothetical protein